MKIFKYFFLFLSCWYLGFIFSFIFHSIKQLGKIKEAYIVDKSLLWTTIIVLTMPFLIGFFTGLFLINKKD